MFRPSLKRMNWKNVISKIVNPISIKTILVLDGTNGSNMIKQAEIFGKEIKEVNFFDFAYFDFSVWQ